MDYPSNISNKIIKTLFFLFFFLKSDIGSNLANNRFHAPLFSPDKMYVKKSAFLFKRDAEF